MKSLHLNNANVVGTLSLSYLEMTSLPCSFHWITDLRQSNFLTYAFDFEKISYTLNNKRSLIQLVRKDGHLKEDCEMVCK